ncbi:MAG: hypothetical protein Q9221_001371 [Calogaya cf. arnoldii]
MKLTYRFPSWFWNRAIRVSFMGGKLGPELVLRFACVRPFESDWGTFVREGAVEDLKCLIDRKQADLNDIDSKYGMTALHWSMHYCQVDMVSFLIRSGADWAAEDGFGLTPRHCLLFDYKHSIPCDGTRRNRLLLLQQYSTLDNSSESELLEEPAHHSIYRDKNTHNNLRASLRFLGDIDDADALGHTLLTKAIVRSDVPTENGASATQRNRHGYTCIWLACGIGCTKIVRLLLDYGADPTIGTHWDPNFDAVAVTVFKDWHDVMKILFEHLKGQYHIRPNEGSNLLHMAAWHASIQIIELLCSIEYTTSDVSAILNNQDMYGGKTPYDYICSRRQRSVRHVNGTSTLNDDPEQLYKSLMKLIQKVVDDHYGLDACQGHGEGKPKRRMVAVPREGSTKYLDIVEEISLVEVFEDHLESDRSEDSMSEAEEWEDALENLDELKGKSRDNQEANGSIWSSIRTGSIPISILG